MSANTKKLHDLGQSLWVDNISREMLVEGVLARYIADLSVAGLTANPTIYKYAIGHGNANDEAIARLARRGEPAEELFFTLTLDDLKAPADLFRSVFDAAQGIDGWVSLECPSCWPTMRRRRSVPRHVCMRPWTGRISSSRLWVPQPASKPLRHASCDTCRTRRRHRVT